MKGLPENPGVFPSPYHGCAIRSNGCRFRWKAGALDQIPAEPYRGTDHGAGAVRCCAGSGRLGSSSGIGALTGGKAEPGSSDGPSGTPFDITVQEPEGVDDVALQDYAQEYLNITMGIPQGYAENRVRQRSFCFIGWERYPAGGILR